MRYKCIIFDCDGVLVDSEPISIGVLVEMAKELRVEITEAFAFEEFAGKSLRYCFDYIAKRSVEPFPGDFDSEFRRRTFSRFEKELRPTPGIHELLGIIQKPFCVASSGPIEKIRLNLGVTNLLEKFEGRIFSSYEINSWKPEPGIFLHAASAMGFKPNECVVIEDSIAGVQAAKAGHFDVFGFAPTERSMESLEKEGAQVFSGMHQLEDLLRSS